MGLDVAMNVLPLGDPTLVSQPKEIAGSDSPERLVFVFPKGHWKIIRWWFFFQRWSLPLPWLLPSWITFRAWLAEFWLTIRVNIICSLAILAAHLTISNLDLALVTAV